MKATLLFLVLLAFHVLGADLTLQDGTTFRNISVVTNLPFSVKIKHATGMAVIPYKDMNEADRPRFGYDEAVVDAEIARLKDEAVAKKAEAEKQAAERKAREPSAIVPLTGKDLQAWRTAHVVADKRCHAFNEVDEDDPKRKVYMILNGPSYALDTQPTRQCMTKNPAGDWSFTFLAKSKPSKQPDAPTYANRKIVVRVVDYGAEMGVESTKITTEP